MTYLPDLHTDAETRCWLGDVVLRDLEVWIAEDDGRVVGFAALGQDLLEHLYVHPEAQNHRVGATLLAVAKERRPRALRLWVFQKNLGARPFYERHGFTLVPHGWSSQRRTRARRLVRVATLARRRPLQPVRLPVTLL